MNAQEIFLPMLGMMTLTAVVWFHMYAKRLPAMRRAGLDAQAYATPGKIAEHLSEDVNNPANNFKNLFELPVLFYGLCFYLFLSGNVDAAYLIAAWLFFLFRVAHSIVHCTRNIVMLRFLLYSGAAFSLWFMLGRAVLNVLNGMS